MEQLIEEYGIAIVLFLVGIGAFEGLRVLFYAL